MLFIEIRDFQLHENVLVRWYFTASSIVDPFMMISEWFGGCSHIMQAGLE